VRRPADRWYRNSRCASFRRFHRVDSAGYDSRSIVFPMDSAVVNVLLPIGFWRFVALSKKLKTADGQRIRHETSLADTDLYHTGD